MNVADPQTMPDNRVALWRAGSAWRARAIKRFGELAVKEALGKTTPQETAKLDRYQKLRRAILGTDKPHPRQAQQDYHDALLMKKVRALQYQFSQNK